MTDQEQLRLFLAEQKYMVLAVTLDDGTPWATPVRIKTQYGTAFEWDSMQDAEHSKALLKHPNVAITIFTDDSGTNAQFGFYAKATASKVSDGEHGIGRYHAIVSQAWVNDQTFVKRKVEMVQDV